MKIKKIIITHIVLTCYTQRSIIYAVVSFFIIKKVYTPGLVLKNYCY